MPLKPLAVNICVNVSFSFLMYSASHVFSALLNRVSITPVSCGGGSRRRGIYWHVWTVCPIVPSVFLIINRSRNGIRPSFSNSMVNFMFCELRQYCTAAFLDGEQAFDRAWHEGLMFKLKGFLPFTYYLILKSSFGPLLPSFFTQFLILHPFHASRWTPRPYPIPNPILGVCCWHP